MLTLFFMKQAFILKVFRCRRIVNLITDLP